MITSKNKMFLKIIILFCIFKFITTFKGIFSETIDTVIFLVQGSIMVLS